MYYLGKIKMKKTNKYMTIIILAIIAIFAITFIVLYSDLFKAEEQEVEIEEIFYEDYGIKTNQTGVELMEGIDIHIPIRPGSLLISYKIKE